MVALVIFIQKHSITKSRFCSIVTVPVYCTYVLEVGLSSVIQFFAALCLICSQGTNLRIFFQHTVNIDRILILSCYSVSKSGFSLRESCRQKHVQLLLAQIQKICDWLIAYGCCSHILLDLAVPSFLFSFQRAVCALCSDRIWGLGRQGFKCINCKMLVHKKCHKFLKIPCGSVMVCNNHLKYFYCTSC